MQIGVEDPVLERLRQEIPVRRYPERLKLPEEATGKGSTR